MQISYFLFVQSRSRLCRCFRLFSARCRLVFTNDGINLSLCLVRREVVTFKRVFVFTLFTKMFRRILSKMKANFFVLISYIGPSNYVFLILVQMCLFVARFVFPYFFQYLSITKGSQFEIASDLSNLITGMFNGKQ